MDYTETGLDRKSSDRSIWQGFTSIAEIRTVNTQVLTQVLSSINTGSRTLDSLKQNMHFRRDPWALESFDSPTRSALDYSEAISVNSVCMRQQRDLTYYIPEYGFPEYPRVFTWFAGARHVFIWARLRSQEPGYN